MENLKTKISQSPMDTNVKVIFNDLLKIIEENTNPIHKIQTNTNAKEFFEQNSKQVAEAIRNSLKPKEELVFGFTKEEFMKFIYETIANTIEKIIEEKSNQITFNSKKSVIKIETKENMEDLTTMEDLKINNTKEGNVKIVDEADMKKQSVKLPNKKLTKK